LSALKKQITETKEIASKDSLQPRSGSSKSVNRA
jgi:hypothetical protein